MDSIFTGSLATRRDRAIAWADALFVDHAVFRVVWNRFAPVAPGLYRIGHPTPGQIARLTRRHGLRTLINLRGQSRNGADALAREAARRAGLAFVDAPLESRGAPQRDRVLRLCATFATMAEPALVHCKSGADRAGLAAAIFVLSRGGTSAQALRQLSWRFGHVRASKTGVLDAFILAYARDAEGRLAFEDWVRDEYDRDALLRDFSARRGASFLVDRVLRRE